MNPKASSVNRRSLNRRAFLTGAGTIAIGLPFLEGLPSRSAWAADNPPVFTFFVVGQNGVVPKSFFPSATGALTQAGLAAATGAATTLAGGPKGRAPRWLTVSSHKSDPVHSGAALVYLLSPLLADPDGEISRAYEADRWLLNLSKRIAYVIDRNKTVLGAFHHEFSAEKHLEDVKRTLRAASR